MAYSSGAVEFAAKVLPSEGGNYAHPPRETNFHRVVMAMPELPPGPAQEAVRQLLTFELNERLGERAGTCRVKRAVDVFGSLAGLVLFALPMLVIACAIKLSSPGPVLFHQLRHGRHNRPFFIAKFRTMHTHLQDVTGAIQTCDSDPRVTGIGRFLRRWNLDELPQLWNVLSGDMSLIGPRAHPLAMQASGRPYDTLVAAYPLRHLVRPGMTGRAQVLGLRGETRDPKQARERIANDLTYIASMSLGEDVRILFRTIGREFLGGTGS